MVRRLKNEPTILYSMRKSLFALTLLVAASACKIESTTQPVDVPLYHVVATVTGSNTCAVSAMDKTYGSIGQVAGDVPSKFIGTLDKNYHGLSCWVSVDGGNTKNGGDAFINIIFSGNNFGKPLAVGTYKLTWLVLDETPPMTATIRFHPSDLDGDELRPLDNAVGSIVVDSAANGARTIHVDLQAIRYSNRF
jgi:hypothetical protein